VNRCTADNRNPLQPVCRARRTFTALSRILGSAERISLGMLWLFFGVTNHIRDLQQTEIVFHPKMWNISSTHSAIKGNKLWCLKNSQMIPSEANVEMSSCFTFAPCINSIKNTFIVPTDAHYYKNHRMLKQF